MTDLDTPQLPEDYLASLNEEQLKAVTHHTRGGLQILAGPGSGMLLLHPGRECAAHRLTLLHLFVLPLVTFILRINHCVYAWTTRQD